MDRKLAIDTLKEFCSFDISTSKEVMKKFEELPGAIAHYDGGKNNFVYIPGTREDRVLLVSHADTVWDEQYNEQDYKQEIFESYGALWGRNKDCGIGADDRAGCAILWLLRNSGHSLLITDGEEIGCVGSEYLRDNYPKLFDELNDHCYMMQFDRRECENYKVYRLPVSDEFIEFVERETGYYNSGKSSSTDITRLCRDICGVNLCIGYYNEHTPNEAIVLEEWLQVLNLAEKILKEKQKKYPLVK